MGCVILALLISLSVVASQRDTLSQKERVCVVVVDTVWMQPVYFTLDLDRQRFVDTVLVRMCEEARKDAALYREVRHD
jgi:hypothetical protein